MPEEEEDTPLLLRVVLVEFTEVPELLREEDELLVDPTFDEERLLELERDEPTAELLRVPDVLPDDLIEELRPVELLLRVAADSRDDDRVDDPRRDEEVLRPVLLPDER